MKKDLTKVIFYDNIVLKLGESKDLKENTKMENYTTMESLLIDLAFENDRVIGEVLSSLNDESLKQNSELVNELFRESVDNLTKTKLWELAVMFDTVMYGRGLITC